MIDPFLYPSSDAQKGLTTQTNAQLNDSETHQFVGENETITPASQAMATSWELALSLAKGCISFDLNSGEMNTDDMEWDLS